MPSRYRTRCAGEKHPCFERPTGGCTQKLAQQRLREYEGTASETQQCGIRLIVEAARQERGSALQLTHEVRNDKNPGGTVFGQQQVIEGEVRPQANARWQRRFIGKKERRMILRSAGSIRSVKARSLIVTG
jgi:hypothetical protein